MQVGGVTKVSYKMTLQKFSFSLHSCFDNKKHALVCVYHQGSSDPDKPNIDTMFWLKCSHNFFSIKDS